MENNEIKNVTELNAEAMEMVAGGRSSSGRRVKAVSGDSYVRKDPDNDAAYYGMLSRGDSVPYLEEKRWDDCDVAWYKVNFRGHKSWVSSHYTRIV